MTHMIVKTILKLSNEEKMILNSFALLFTFAISRIPKDVTPNVAKSTK